MIPLQLFTIFLMGFIIGILADKVRRFIDEVLPTHRAIKKRMQQQPQARLSPNRKRK